MPWNGQGTMVFDFDKTWKSQWVGDFHDNKKKKPIF